MHVVVFLFLPPDTQRHIFRFPRRTIVTRADTRSARQDITCTLACSRRSSASRTELTCHPTCSLADGSGAADYRYRVGRGGETAPICPKFLFSCFQSGLETTSSSSSLLQQAKFLSQTSCVKCCEGIEPTAHAYI